MTAQEDELRRHDGNQASHQVAWEPDDSVNPNLVDTDARLGEATWARNPLIHSRDNNQT